MLGAIDVGSNAIRLVIGSVLTTGSNRTRSVEVLKKVREPVRLGQDAFAKGEITPKTAARALETFHKFRQILDDHGIEHLRAVATSALRDVKNRDSFVARVLEETGIRLEVIDGLEEGRLIHEAVASRVDLSGHDSLLIDIGGGSVELTISRDGRIKAVRTFKLGTLRLLQMLEAKGLKEKHLPALLHEKMAPVRAFLNERSKKRPFDICIGTGGNFECLGKLRVALLNRSSIHSMTHDELARLVEHLSSLSVRERTRYLRLKPDRADVIVPAATVALMVMEMAQAEFLSIPYVGLRDGLLTELASRH